MLEAADGYSNSSEGSEALNAATPCLRDHLTRSSAEPTLTGGAAVSFHRATIALTLLPVGQVVRRPQACITLRLLDAALSSRYAYYRRRIPTESTTFVSIGVSVARVYREQHSSHRTSAFGQRRKIYRKQHYHVCHAQMII